MITYINIKSYETSHYMLPSNHMKATQVWQKWIHDDIFVNITLHKSAFLDVCLEIIAAVGTLLNEYIASVISKGFWAKYQ